MSVLLFILGILLILVGLALLWAIRAEFGREPPVRYYQRPTPLRNSRRKKRGL